VQGLLCAVTGRQAVLDLVHRPGRRRDQGRCGAREYEGDDDEHTSEHLQPPRAVLSGSSLQYAAESDEPEHGQLDTVPALGRCPQLDETAGAAGVAGGLIHGPTPI
jgi:hypothetical protein